MHISKFSFLVKSSDVGGDFALRSKTQLRFIKYLHPFIYSQLRLKKLKFSKDIKAL
jgi:hypothetical protein